MNTNSQNPDFRSTNSENPAFRSPTPVTANSPYGTPDRWFVLFFLAVNYAVLIMQRNGITFVLVPLKADLALSDLEVGWLQTAFLVPYGASQLFVGYLSDRFTRRNVLMASLAASLLSLAGMGLVSSFNGLVDMRIILGFAQAASVPAIASVMGDVFTAKSRSTAVALYFCSYSIAMSFAGWAGGTIADMPPLELGDTSAILAGWRTAFFTFSTIGLAWLGCMAFFFREPQRAERQQGTGLGKEGGSFGQTILSIVSVPSFMMIALVFLLYCIVNNVREFWLPRYTLETFGMSLEEAGVFSTQSIMFSTIVGNLIGGLWADWWAAKFRSGRLVVQAIAMLIWIPALVAIGSTADKDFMNYGMIAWGFAFGVYSVNLWTTTFDVVDPAARATATGLLNVFGMVASFVSPLIGYGIDPARQWYGLADVFNYLSVLSAVCFVFIALTILLFLKRDYRGPLQCD